MSALPPKADVLSAGIDVRLVPNCLELAKRSDIQRALVRLTALMRRIKPDVVMTWLLRAPVLATIAAIASGAGAKRVVWNMSGSSPNASTRKSRLMLRLLAVLSPLPWAIAVGSRSDRRIYEALGFRPRRWFGVYNSADEDATESVLGSYRQLWRFAAGVEAFPVRPGFLQRRMPPLVLNWWAQLRRLSLTKTTFIAVTGSCGKTTTVRLADSVLKTDGPCLRRGGNVPRAIVRNVLAVPAYSKYCIQEVSGHFPGAIAGQVRVLRPHIAIVTTAGSDHYTNFRGLEATAKEKGGLVEALPRHGTAILNADDPHVRAMTARTRARVLLYGLSPDADLRATEISSVWPERLALTVAYGDETVRVSTRLVGEFWTTSVLAAMACVIACGIDLRTCAKIAETFDPVFGRYSVHIKPGGPAYVLDSTKAPYWTIAAGLAFVAQAQAPRKTIVFGMISDMPGRGDRKYRRVARDALQGPIESSSRGPVPAPSASYRLKRICVRGCLHSKRATKRALSWPKMPFQMSSSTSRRRYPTISNELCCHSLIGWSAGENDVA